MGINPKDVSQTIDETRMRFTEMISEITSSIEKMYETILETFSWFDTFLSKNFSLESEEFQEIKSHMKGNNRAVRAISDSLETLSVRTIALQAPVGKSLRTILSSFKMSYDLERISRYTYNAFRSFARITPDNEEFFLGELDLLKNAFANCKTLLEYFNEVYTLNLQDAEFDYSDLVDKSSNLDDQIDELFAKHSKSIIKSANKAKIKPDNAHYLLSAIRSLERLGDHSCNLIERAVYMQTGDRIEIR